MGKLRSTVVNQTDKEVQISRLLQGRRLEDGLHLAHLLCGLRCNTLNSDLLESLRLHWSKHRWMFQKYGPIMRAPASSKIMTQAPLRLTEV